MWHKAEIPAKIRKIIFNKRSCIDNKGKEGFEYLKIWGFATRWCTIHRNSKKGDKIFACSTRAQKNMYEERHMFNVSRSVERSQSISLSD